MIIGVATFVWAGVCTVIGHWMIVGTLLEFVLLVITPSINLREVLELTNSVTRDTGKLCKWDTIVMFFKSVNYNLINSFYHEQRIIFPYLSVYNFVGVVVDDPVWASLLFLFLFLFLNSIRLY